ncbi:MAG: glucosamine-6-phosphate deaminase [Thermomicrobiales bacterium]|nr:glucosamine-6-phosphate deaminase [Thermomicrobiales bacterium]
MEPTLIVVPDYTAMSEMAADIVVETLNSDPTAAISLPTGSTPVGMFESLIRRSRAGDVDLTRFQLFCLDEYLGVTPDDPNTLTSWLHRTFIHPAGIPAEHVHSLPVTADNPSSAATDYEQAIVEAGGLKLAVLGIGGNGHVAYNEPGAAADSRTRVLDLAQESIDQAAVYFDGASVPRQAMSMGVGTLLEAEKIVLIVSGESKQEILRKTLRDPMSADVPASWLRLQPKKVTVIADEAATGLLST